MIILGTAALILAVLASWQIGPCELANMNLKEDLRDLASKLGIHVGLVTPTSDEDVNLAVIRH